MNGLLNRLMLSGSAVALITTSAFVATSALAQTAANQSVESVTVTGTSIRGEQPVGTNLISMSAADIQDTGADQIQQALAANPVISGFGNAGEGGAIHNNYYQPSIHQLGASASNATLVLFDGHLAPTGGTNHNTVDPNMIPTNMIESVDVIANGDSAIYGSNAVAGVINFRTRSEFDGVQINGQSDIANGTSNLSAGILSGTSWQGGNVLVAYQYYSGGALLASQRGFSANTDQTAAATADGLPVAAALGSATNFSSFTGAGPNCAQPLVRINGSGNYYNLVTGTQYTTAQSSAPCNLAAENTLVQADTRNTLMMKLKQDFGSKLTVTSEILYATRQDTGPQGAGTVSAVTAYPAGSANGQGNPFFQLPAGYTGTATSETVYANLDQLLGGPQDYIVNGSKDMYADVNGEYRIGGDWVINALAVAGSDDSYSKFPYGGVANGSSVDLGLNGTTNSGGNTTTPAVAATTIVPLNLPLTTANALDIWGAGTANQTSQTVISNIESSQSLLELISGFEQFRVSGNGTVFSLPAGPLKVAIGGEYDNNTLSEHLMASNGTGPATTGSSFINFNFHRSVRSGFIELDAPIVSPDMAIPLMEKFEVNISGRHDGYSDVGNTDNYKMAFSWDVIDGLKLRGNMSTSFVAPGLDIVGSKNNAFVTSTYGLNTSLDGIAIPVSAYPALTSFAPSQFSNGKACTAASVTCVLASTVQGVEINNGDHNVKPQRGRGWEVGADFAPEFLPGFSSAATLWNTEFLGAITGPTAGNVINNAGENSQATFYPAGLSAATVNTLGTGIRQSSALPTTISYLWYSTNTNWLYLYLKGIDANFDYKFDTDYGAFNFGDSLTELLSYQEANGLGSVRYSVLNTTGANSSFPSIQTNMRIHVGWSLDAFTAALFVNFTGSYRNWSGTSVSPLILNAQGNPSSGGDKVNANTTVDLHTSYEFTSAVGDDVVSLSVLNIANTTPPFYLGSTGYDTWSGNPLGRIVKISLTAKL